MLKLGIGSSGDTTSTEMYHPDYRYLFSLDVLFHFFSELNPVPSVKCCR